MYEAKVFNDKSALVDRFLRYVKIDTTADEMSETYPSSQSNSIFPGCCVMKLRRWVYPRLKWKILAM
jgi:hypothetical protein